MRFLRNWEQVSSLDLTEAENKLIASCYESVGCKLVDGHLPLQCSNPYRSRKVRASVLRYLLLGGCADNPLPICSINLQGAHITGNLDLDQQKIHHPLVLSECRVSGEISAIGAFIPAIEISKCVILKMSLERISIRNDVCLDGTKFLERVNMSGARIGGQLDCENAEFGSCNNVLGPGPNAPSYAFDGQDMRIGHGFFWKNVTIREGAVDVGLAQVGALVDDYDSWPNAGRLRLNGFQYNGLANSPKDTKGRKTWLKNGSYWNGEFYPQPYTQLAKALRELGHDADARVVLEERERRLKIETRKAMQRDTVPPSRNYVVALMYDLGRALHYIFAD